MSTWAQPGRLRRPGRGLKTVEKSANSQFSKPPHTQNFGHPRTCTRSMSTQRDICQKFHGAGSLQFTFAQVRASMLEDRHMTSILSPYRSGRPRNIVSSTSRLSGFTLIELMIVVAVVAIMSAIALPAYSKYIVRAKLTEAFNALSAYSLSLGQYYQDNRTYVGGCTANPPTSSNFSYACTLNANTYTLTATGSTVATTGFVFTLTESGSRATTGAPSGWPTNTSCWVSSSSGSCQ